MAGVRRRADPGRAAACLLTVLTGLSTWASFMAAVAWGAASRSPAGAPPRRACSAAIGVAAPSHSAQHVSTTFAEVRQPFTAHKAGCALQSRSRCTLRGTVMERPPAKQVADNQDDEEGEVQQPLPVLYSWPLLFRRLQRQSQKPGHVVQRKWLQKGRDQGYVSVPFSTAVRSILPESDVNVCLIGRRETSDALSNSWQKAIDAAPLFDISGEVSAPRDLDPLEAPWDTPLDEPLPSDEEVRAMARQGGGAGPLVERMTVLYRDRDPEELVHRTNEFRQPEEEDAVLFRRIVEGLPPQLREEEFRSVIRGTIVEVLKLLWTVHVASDAVRMRWRLACTDGNAGGPQDSNPLGLRAYFVLAGEGLEFVPSQYVDAAKVAAASALSPEQFRRMSSDDWAASVTTSGCNVTEALKRVPSGWTTFLKGEAWPDMQDKGAVYRLPPAGKRVFIQVDFLKGPAKTARAEVPVSGQAGEEEPPEKIISPFLRTFGPLAGVLAALFELFRRSPPFLAGQQRRREVNELLRALQKVREPKFEVESAIGKFEQRVWMDFGDADEAPVVLVVGGQTRMGQIVSRKLVMSGYHVVLLKPSGGGSAEGAGDQQAVVRVERLMPQGAVLVSAPVKPRTQPVSVDPGRYHMPNDLYDAVAGIDKVVICGCEDAAAGFGAASLTGLAVKDVLACWQLYRMDYAEKQRSYTPKVRLFNFQRQTDFELWDLERQKPSDLCYGQQRVGWTRNSYKKPLFIGQFFEPVAQALLKSPRLKLNFKRFSGLLVRVYNQAVDNTYSWFLRTSDFEETRLQYEFEFSCQASRWHVLRMPFNAFRAMRADGVPLPEGEAENFPLKREDVKQMGIAVRTGNDPRSRGQAVTYFSLALDYIKVFRMQPEPQVICMGRVEDASGNAEEAEQADEADEPFFFSDDMNLDEALRNAEAAAAAEIEELAKAADNEAALVEQEEDVTDVSTGRPRSAMQAVLESGLAYTIIKVSGLNEYPGGKFPITIRQAPVTKAPLSPRLDSLGSLSCGDAAALVVSALNEPTCVNTEIEAGTDLNAIRSTLQENVKARLRQLTPNK